MATRTTLNTEQEALWYLGNLRIIQAIGEQAGRAVHLTEYVLPAGTHIYTGTKMKVSMWRKEKPLFLVGRRS